MEYSKLLDLTTELGYQLAIAGAETFRVEESIIRVLNAYDIEAEVFAIPNCLHVSIEPIAGRPLTRMRRIGIHGNNFDAVERFTNLSRKLCAQRPAPEIAQQWLAEEISGLRTYPLLAYMLGSLLGPFGFCFLFGGSFVDAVCAGICGIFICLIDRQMEQRGANQFFRILISAFLMALPAYGMGALGIADNADAVIIGALMLLVPGLLFTNALRDIIHGDTNSGINRIAQVMLIALAIALGATVAKPLSQTLWGDIPEMPAIAYSCWLQALTSFIGCFGFSLLFNIHGPGGLLCAAGGVFTWLAYALTLQFSGNDLLATFFGTLFAAIYSEIMARIRKYPAISYLVVSIFPLIPGSGVYFTVNYAIEGQMDMFAQTGLHTVAIAGLMAVAILLGSTAVRLFTSKQKK